MSFQFNFEGDFANQQQFGPRSERLGSYQEFSHSPIIAQPGRIHQSGIMSPPMPYG